MQAGDQQGWEMHILNLLRGIAGVLNGISSWMRRLNASPGRDDFLPPAIRNFIDLDVTGQRQITLLSKGWNVLHQRPSAAWQEASCCEMRTTRCRPAHGLRLLL
jgi:hypothetical protein